MGDVLSMCADNKSRPPSFASFDSRRITNVPPNQIEDRMTILPPQVEKFYYIPNEEQIDKAIQHLDEASILSEQDFQLLAGTIRELCYIRKKYRLPDSSHIMITGGDKTPRESGLQGEVNQKRFTMAMQENNKEDVLRRTRTFGIPHKSPFQDAVGKKGPYLVAEVQSARFLHEEIIGKHNLQKPYVVVKIYQKSTAKRRDKSSPTAKAEIKAFKSKTSEETVKPVWNELFEYPVKVGDEEKESQFALYSVGVSLFYNRGTSKDVWQVGEEQHFSLSSLQDQRMQVKTVDFKDEILKGVLAMLVVKLQLVHDIEKVKERMSEDVDLRIERLLKIKERHVLTDGQRISNIGFLNVIGATGSGPSASVYSFTGLKENEYFLN